MGQDEPKSSDAHGPCRPRSIHVVEQSGIERWIELERNPITIGRDRSCRVQLESPYVSRQHARIDVRSGGPVLLDLGSHNGSLVNGVAATGCVELMDGDVISIGDVTITCVAEAALVTRTLVPREVKPIKPDVLRVDADGHEVWIGDQHPQRSLSAQEFQLLRYLFAHRDRVCTRQELGDSVWGEHNWDQNMLHRLAHRLKGKLEPRPGEPRYVQTVPWIGYRLTI